MDEVGANEAKTDLAQLPKRVSRGERFTITKHDVPVAPLVPVPARHDRRRAAMSRFVFVCSAAETSGVAVMPGG